VDNLTKIDIECPIHGIFNQCLYSHSKGAGCPKCVVVIGGGNSLSKEDRCNNFIEKANVIHNSFYNYDNILYDTARKHVEIVCNNHGSFLQTPDNHLKGKGCPKCYKERSLIILSKTSEKFIEESKIIFGDRFDYSNMMVSSILNQ
jgi:hypothetical protein